MGRRGHVPVSGIWGMPFAALVVCAAAVGGLYQALATRRDDRLYPPPGRLIDVGGHRLHLQCAGAGGPVVVLDAGLGSFSVDWGLVTPEVAAFTTACAYDRAGYGWSEPGPRPRTSRQIARELHRLLQLAAMPGPYVLVGHSFGGFNIRLFADLYRDEVAGLVLVDASHEDAEARLPRELRAGYRRLMQAMLLAWQVGRLGSALGLVRLLGERGLMPLFAVFDALPPSVRRLARVFRYRARYYATCYVEDVCYAESAAQARAAQVHRVLPVAVVVATCAKGLTKDAAPLPGRAGKLVHTLREQEQDLQQALARRLSPESRFLAAEHSGHLIPFDQPEVVVEAIRWVVERARR